MTSAFQLDLSYNQVLDIVKQLPQKEKLKLSKELEKEGVKNRLAKILASFKTNEISDKDINEEVELVRKELYESKK